MLTKEEENYLQSIPEDEVVNIRPYDPELENIAQEIISKVRSKIPNVDVRFMGASALKISGQGDVDIYVLYSVDTEFENTLNTISRIFGEPKTQKSDFAEWDLSTDSYEITLYLDHVNNPSIQRQIKVHTKLESNPKLLKEYEKLKELMNGKSYREYQKQKYEFYYKILQS